MLFGLFRRYVTLPRGVGVAKCDSRMLPYKNKYNRDIGEYREFYFLTGLANLKFDLNTSTNVLFLSAK